MNAGSRRYRFIGPVGVALIFALAIFTGENGIDPGAAGVAVLGVLVVYVVLRQMRIRRYADEHLDRLGDGSRTPPERP